MMGVGFRLNPSYNQSQQDAGCDMPRMKGGELIAEYLVRNRIPYVFGICGHGNVGMLDAL